MVHITTKINGSVCAPKGFRANGVYCGIRKNKSKRDLCLIVSDVPAVAAAMYTQNKVKGAPITVTQENLSDNMACAVICNSGNANTCNADGIHKAKAMCEATAKALGISASDVIVASTGVIGQPLPIEPILSGMDELVEGLSYEGDEAAAEAILTTDLTRKELAVSFEIGGVTCRMGGIAKGSGMIHINMATMLSFLTTDVLITPDMLNKALKQVVADTYNMVSVDGDTSTNDMVSIMANGQANNPVIDKEGADFDTFTAALTEISTYLSKAIAADGEGATKLLECTVIGADSKDTAKAVAKSVITSSLFKAAMFGKDANWGRILCAVGYAPCDVDISKVGVTLKSSAGEVIVCENGSGVEFSEEKALAVLSENEIGIDIRLGKGDYRATAWGCDLTYDYVKINGDYRT